MVTQNYFSQTKQVDSLKLLLNTTKEDTEKILIRNLIGEQAGINRISYWDSIKISCEQLLSRKENKAVINTTNILLSTVYNNIGYFAERKGDIALALKSYNVSLNISESLNDKEGIAGTQNNLALLYWQQGDLNASLPRVRSG